MPIKIRKVFLTFCRVQTLRSIKLYAEVAELESSGMTGFMAVGVFYNTRRLLTWMQPYEDKPLSLGFISMLIRTESHMDLNELEEALETAVRKEVQAAIDPAKEPTFDYSCLFSNDPMDRYKPLTKNHAEGPRVSTYFYNRICSLRDAFADDKIDPIIPTYSRKKSVSRSMARSYNQYSNSPLDETEVTSLDCLKLYAQTGHMTQGFTELRSAFRYTDLAPRAYYTVGGDAYYKAVYVKHFAKRLTTCLPVTSPTNHSRYNISRLNYKSESHTVLLYDYSSFTSNLTALSGFLIALSDFFRGTPVKVFDPYLGIIVKDLGTLLLDYNSALDEKLLFSLDRLFPTQDGDEEFFMAKNGPLGAQGNINFSMILHGLNMALAIDDLNLVNVVGDDAIVLIDVNVWEREYILGVINLLGAVADRKTIWMRWEWWMTEEDVLEASWHFMKRPLRVYGDRITSGTLIDFPSLGFLQPSDGYHVTRKFPRDSVINFLLQVGVFFDDIADSPLEFDQWETRMIQQVLFKVYQQHGLSFGGHFPGKLIRSPRFDEFSLKISVCPLLDDCFRRPWREVMWDGADGHGMIEDLDFRYKVSLPGLSIEWDWTETEKSRVVGAFVDFGFMEMKIGMRWYDLGSTQDRRAWLHSKDPKLTKVLYRVKQLRELSTPFRDLYYAYSK